MSYIRYIMFHQWYIPRCELRGGHGGGFTVRSLRVPEKFLPCQDPEARNSLQKEHIQNLGEIRINAVKGTRLLRALKSLITLC